MPSHGYADTRQTFIEITGHHAAALMPLLFLRYVITLTIVISRRACRPRWPHVAALPYLHSYEILLLPPPLAAFATY